MSKREVWWRCCATPDGVQWTLRAPEQGTGCLVRPRRDARPGEGRFLVEVHWDRTPIGRAQNLRYWAYAGSVPKARRIAERWLLAHTDFSDRYAIKEGRQS